MYIKNWYCLEFDLTGYDLGFTTRFWISMTELFGTMNSFVITERNENQWIYQCICDIQIIWKLSYLISLRIIVFEPFYVDCIPFSCIDHFQILFSNFQKTWLNHQLCGRNPIKSFMFICLSGCDAFSSESTLWIFKIFCMKIFCHIY